MNGLLKLFKEMITFYCDSCEKYKYTAGEWCRGER